MSRNRVSEKAGWARYSKLPRGPGGRALCRWCDKEVPKGRRTFCGDECVHEHKLRSDPGYVRRKLFERDVGVCAACRADTEALRHLVRKGMWSHNPDIAEYPQAAQAAFCRIEGESYEDRRRRIGTALGVPERFHGLELSRSWWEADHIVPVVEGGGECGLEGYRTLCVPCHKDVTKELRARLKKAKRGRQDGPEATQAGSPSPEPQATPAGSPGRPRVRRTPVPAAGLRHDRVPEVRRPGGDDSVQDHVPAVRDRGDV